MKKPIELNKRTGNKFYLKREQHECYDSYMILYYEPMQFQFTDPWFKLALYIRMMIF